MKALVKLSISLILTASIGNSVVLAGQTVKSLEPSTQAIHFFKKQVDNSSSISNALKNLIDRYPHRTAEFVSIAFSAYPEHYSEIITTSVSIQPTFVEEIIMLANEYDVAKPTEIVELAINAEPSYAGAATSAACKYSPNYFEEIIRVAVTTEPDSADQIAQKLVAAFPSKTMEILITTIKEVPFVGKYVLDALLATVSDDSAKSEDMIVISVEQLAQYPDAIDRLVQLAHERDIDSEKVRLSAIKGGLSEEAIAAVIKQHY